MKFALVNNERQEAQPGLSGECPAYGHPMVARCGEERVWHWAHRGKHTCDLWWENETEWHRAWKNQFPDEWQEAVQHAPNGEKHVADVKTDYGWAIEFQHSYITPEERRSRDAFYQKLVWVVNGARRKTDAVQFAKAWNAGAPVGAVRRVRSDECRLLREWAGSDAPIFFDFGNGPTLWWLHAKGPDEPAYVAPFSRIDVIQIGHGKGPEMARDFEEFARTLNESVTQYEQRLQQASGQPLPDFERYVARRNRRRGRL
jgi:hypothetical protein